MEDKIKVFRNCKSKTINGRKWVRLSNNETEIYVPLLRISGTLEDVVQEVLKDTYNCIIVSRHDGINEPNIHLIINEDEDTKLEVGIMTSKDWFIYEDNK